MALLLPPRTAHILNCVNNKLSSYEETFVHLSAEVGSVNANFYWHHIRINFSLALFCYLSCFDRCPSHECSRFVVAHFVSDSKLSCMYSFREKDPRVWKPMPLFPHVCVRTVNPKHESGVLMTRKEQTKVPQFSECKCTLCLKRGSVHWYVSIYLFFPSFLLFLFKKVHSLTLFSFCMVIFYFSLFFLELYH